MEWYGKDRENMPYVTLGGYAGTGKTTLIGVIRKELHKIDPGLKVGFVSFTGKAARILQHKIKEAEVMFRQDTVGTIHSLIYTPILNGNEEIVGWKTKEEIECNLIIVDEASMVDSLIWEHLMSYHVPMIVVGDHGQLPPIRGSFTLMQNPNLKLEEIHRQAKKNPIINVSITARETGDIPAGRYGPTVVKYTRDSSDTPEILQEMLNNYENETLILCGYNKTRKRLNAHIRSALGFESKERLVGDRYICLRNNHKEHIYTGLLGIIAKISRKNDQVYATDIDIDGEDIQYSGLIAVDQFDADTALNFSENRRLFHGIDLFDFGYALTVHKAQGSQARKVILFEERFSKMTDDDWRRWLYTAVTRAEEELYIFPSP